jgi:ABC-2 type transport system permease protein
MTYLRYELLRSFRNWRFLVFSLAYPLVLYFAVAGANRHAEFNGVAFPVYFMAAMATLGAMSAAISSAAVIATERSTGWTRQLRITPLSPRAYLRAKVISGYLRAFFTIALLCLAGIAYGVRLSAGEWGTAIGLLLVGIIPLAALGILLGHLLGADSSMPAIVGVVTLFSLLGGVYGFQIAKSGVMFDVIKGLPSYWLVQAGQTALGGRDWPVQGWVVIAAWTAVIVPLAVLVYRRDTSRASS